MILSGIVESQSHQTHIVFVTEPPLTADIFEQFGKCIGKPEWRECFTLQNGHLIYNEGQSYFPEFKAQITRILTEAENLVNQRIAAEAASLKQHLDGISKNLGIPLVKPAVPPEPI